MKLFVDEPLSARATDAPNGRMSKTPRPGFAEVDVCGSPAGTDGRSFRGPYCSKSPGHQLGCRFDLEDITPSAEVSG